MHPEGIEVKPVSVHASSESGSEARLLQLGRRWRDRLSHVRTTGDRTRGSHDVHLNPTASMTSASNFRSEIKARKKYNPSSSTAPVGRGMDSS
jgi:hypothetical protein